MPAPRQSSRDPPWPRKARGWARPLVDHGQATTPVATSAVASNDQTLLSRPPSESPDDGRDHSHQQLFQDQHRQRWRPSSSSSSSSSSSALNSNSPSTSNSSPSPDCPKGFFMKPLTHTPDYRFNLYVQGLDPETTTRQLYHLFEPYGHILACKINQDVETGACRGGFVLFDNQESCTQARRELTLQGFYVAVANEMVSIRNLPPAEASMGPEVKVPEFDNNEAFPSLPSKAHKKHAPKKSPVINEPFPSTAGLVAHSQRDNAVVVQHPEPSVRNEAPRCLRPATPEYGLSNESLSPPVVHDHYGFSDVFPLGQAYLDFDSGFIASHQRTMSSGFSPFSEYGRRASLFGEKPFEGVDGIDRYMNMLELGTAAAVATPQISGNLGQRPPLHPSEAHISKTTIDDFVLEDRPRQDSSLHFEHLPDGLTYLQLFEICASFGSLVLSSVDIRYINEECSGQGRVTFESYQDSKTALATLLERNYTVRHGDCLDPSTEFGIEESLYEQYYQQHQDELCRTQTVLSGLPDETMWTAHPSMLFPSSPGSGSFMPYHDEYREQGQLWSTLLSEQSHQLDNGIYRMSDFSPSADMESAFSKREGLHMSNGSLSTMDNTSPSLHEMSSRAWSEPSSCGPSEGTRSLEELSSVESKPSTPTCNKAEDEEEVSTSDSSPPSRVKSLSYSDIVKVPPKPVVPTAIKNASQQHDLKRRGNTNVSLNENEYRLNLFLRNLEPTMNEYKLYEICIQYGPVMSCRTITTNNGACIGLGFVMYIGKASAERAIEGLSNMGYHAEVAIESATNKLRCKAISDLLFVQNIPSNIREHKLRDLFRPYTLLSCNILKDPKTGKSRGVGFIKVKDTRTAERLIEEYHGRVLGKDWKMPIQVSPAK